MPKGRIPSDLKEQGESPGDENSPVDGSANALLPSESGRFKCPFPNCNKSFTRQEHLSRHKLNHWPKEIFRCSHVFPETGLSCNRTFVRKDLLVRHEKRHSKLGSRLSNHAPVVAITTINHKRSIDELKPRRHSAEPLGTMTQSLRNNMKVNSNSPTTFLPQTGFNPGTNHMPMSEALTAEQILLSNDQQVINNPTQVTSDQTNSQNSNQVFNWLQETNNSNTQQQAQFLNTNKKGLINSQFPQIAPNLSQENSAGLTQGSPSSLFNINSKPTFGTSKSSSPAFEHTSIQDSSSQLTHAHLDSLLSSSGGNQMNDLFSLDFLNNDPLDTFMQELAAPTSTSQNKHSLGETPTSQGSATRPRGKCQDSYRADVKDNLKVQKSNILELQKQNTNLNNQQHEKFSKHSPNYKKRVRSSMVPSFFHSGSKAKSNISEQKCEELMELVPELRNRPTIDLKKALKSFWLNFHPQYGLLHKPSFHVDEQPSILVLALIMVGGSFLGSKFRETISDIICTPLRWIIFSHEDFQPPSKTYIIQSLLLLECYEKTSTNRYLHERSYLHHGTTIQLLRRTPSLGGHPVRLKTEEEPDGLQDPQEVYRRWIECEMLKRVAFYAFYMDSTHAAVFGYLNLFINCNQIQLTMPCSDHVWESHDLSYEVLLDHGFGKGRVTFLSCLKQLLTEVMQTLQTAAGMSPEGYPTKAILKSWDIKSVLGKKVLLAGIISTMFQCQENNGELFATIARGCLCEDDHRDVSWQEILSFTLNYWLFEVQNSAQDPTDCFIKPICLSEEMSDKSISWGDESIKCSNFLNLDTTFSCKIPEYYMAQIILRIFHHDYYIFCGAPWRMNVRTGDEEYALASKRILQVACEPSVGGVALVYAYQFLFDMFIDPMNLSVITEYYNLNRDYIITRPNTLALITLLIWSCTFVLEGPEIQLWNNAESISDRDSLNAEGTFGVKQNELLKDTYIPKESFEQHLLRMYHYLKIDRSLDVVSYQNNVLLKANLLERIKGRNNLCGMVRHMRDKFAESYWDLGREFSKLFDNCLERSMGKTSPTCESMYKV